MQKVSSASPCTTYIVELLACSTYTHEGSAAWTVRQTCCEIYHEIWQRSNADTNATLGKHDSQHFLGLAHPFCHR